MQAKLLRTAICAVAVSAMYTTACNKRTDDTGNLKSAINTYYDAHPECLFPTEKKFPVQADTNNASETTQWDALVDGGLLTRTTAEKSKLIVLSKSVNNYDLSEKGRSAWKADAQQPGFGNFCYGKRVVQNVVSSTPSGSTQPGATSTVNYTYIISNVTDWARAAEVQNAYPSIKAKLASASNAQSMLVLTTNGWQVQGTKSGSDGSVVE